MRNCFTSLRCPENPSRLFGKALLESVDLALFQKITEQALVEFACPDCRRSIQPRPKTVLHRFFLDGTLAETVTVAASAADPHANALTERED